MKGYGELVLTALFTIIIGLVTIAIFAPLIKGEVINPYPEKEINFQTSCTSDDDCEKNYNGSICITAYPSEYMSFCGCRIDDDCKTGAVKRSDICQSNLICKIPIP